MGEEEVWSFWQRRGRVSEVSMYHILFNNQLKNLMYSEYCYIKKFHDFAQLDLRLHQFIVLYWFKILSASKDAIKEKFPMSRVKIRVCTREKFLTVMLKRDCLAGRISRWSRKCVSITIPACTACVTSPS